MPYIKVFQTLLRYMTRPMSPLSARHGGFRQCRTLIPADLEYTSAHCDGWVLCLCARFGL